MESSALACLQVLTDEERTILYNVIDADLLLEKQVLRSKGLDTAALFCNPHFFMGSHIVKAWLDATSSTLQYGEEDNSNIVHSPKEKQKPETVCSTDLELNGSKFVPKKNLVVKDFRRRARSLSPNMLAEEQDVLASLKTRSSSQTSVSQTGSPHHVRKHSIYKIAFQTQQGETTEVAIDRLSKGDYAISGDVYVQIKHMKETLFVSIVEGRNFAAMNKKGYSNPYVKLYLLPDLKESKQKTKVEKKTLNPFYNQTFQYALPKEKLNDRAVWLSVWSKTTLSQLFLGETCIPLASTNLPKIAYKQWEPLQDYSLSDDSLHTAQHDTELFPSTSELFPSSFENLPAINIESESENPTATRPEIFLFTVGKSTCSEEEDSSIVDPGVCITEQADSAIISENYSSSPYLAEEDSSIIVHPAEEDSSIIVIVHPAEEDSSIIVHPAEEDSSIIVHPAEEDSSIIVQVEEDCSIVESSTRISKRVTINETVMIYSMQDDNAAQQNDTVGLDSCEIETRYEAESTAVIVDRPTSLRYYSAKLLSAERPEQTSQEPDTTVQSNSSRGDCTNEILIESIGHLSEMDLENSPSHRKEPVIEKGTVLSTEDIQRRARSLSPNILAEQDVPASLKARSSSHTNLSHTGSPHHVRKHSIYKIAFQTQQGETTEVAMDRLSKGDYAISGDVYVRIKHMKETLFVSIVEGRNFAAMNKKGYSNPYVKLYLLPDLKESKRKTKVEKKTLNPFYNQTFQYALPKEKLNDRAIWVSIWSKTTLSQLFLGETCIPLASTNLPKIAYKQWEPLQDYSLSNDSLHTAQHDTELFSSMFKSFPSSIEKKHLPAGNIENESRNPTATRPDTFLAAAKSTSGEEEVKHFPSIILSPVKEDKSPVLFYQADHNFPPNLDPAERQTLIDLVSFNRRSPYLLSKENSSESPSPKIISTALDIIQEEDENVVPKSNLQMKLPEISTEASSAQVTDVVCDVRAVSKEITLSLYLSDSESDFENSPTHKPVIAGTETEKADRESPEPIDESTLTRKRSQYKINSQIKQGPQHSVVSISRPAKGDYAISGDVYVRIKHMKETLFVSIVEGRNFAAMNKKGYSNPYVKLYLLPDLKESKRKTKVAKKTCHPLYNQTFEYALPKEKLNDRAVWLSVWSKTTLSQLFIGEIRIPLASTNLRTAYKQWLPLEDYSELDTAHTNSSLSSTVAAKMDMLV